MRAPKGEMAAEDQRVAPAVQLRDAAAPLDGVQMREWSGLKRQVIGQAEPPPVGQENAVARLQPHRICQAFQSQPTGAGEERVALDAASVMGRWPSSSKVHPIAGFVLLSVVGVGPPLHAV